MILQNIVKNTVLNCIYFAAFEQYFFLCSKVAFNKKSVSLFIKLKKTI